MITWTSVSALILGCILVLYIRRWARKNQHSFPLPPGPIGLPWIGNVIGFDTNAPWSTYRDWASTYGDIVYSRILGANVIVINSEKVAKELLGGRSKNYSDRPQMVTTALCGVDFVFSAALPYGDQWRLSRQFFNHTFRVNPVLRFIPHQHRMQCQLLRRLFDAPKQLDEHVVEYLASIMLNGTYNDDPSSSKQDELVNIAAKVAETILDTIRPDVAIMVDTFPSLIRLPYWFPGMAFKKRMANTKLYSKLFRETLFEYCSHREPGEGVIASLVHDSLRHMEEKGVEPNEPWFNALKGASATTLLAASESSRALLRAFFLMMTLNPEAQKKAQAQIDAVIGNDRLPTIEDRSSLPWIDAILWETIRYCPPFPLSMPHAAMNDDVYAGFHIPKGAILVPNIWLMTRDEAQFPNPDAYLPERFLDIDGSFKRPNIEYVGFGFGRRICPGRHFADASLWGVIAKVLAVYRISTPKDEHGVAIPVEPRFTGRIIRSPLPFQCEIVPRITRMDVGKLEEMIGASAA